MIIVSIVVLLLSNNYFLKAVQRYDINKLENGLPMATDTTPNTPT